MQRRRFNITTQCPEFSGRQRFDRRINQAAGQRQRGQILVVEHRHPFVAATTKGYTGPDPSLSSRSPTTVIVHLESTTSSTSRIRPDGTVPRIANTPSTLRSCCALFSITFCGELSLTFARH